MNTTNIRTKHFKQDDFQAVCHHAQEAMILQTAADTLEWDERTGMPPSGGDYRASQVAVLRELVHQRRTDPGYGERLERMNDQAADFDPVLDDVATVRELYRDYQINCKLPGELVRRMAEATVRGQQTWDSARKADDYGMFRDALAQIISLKQEAGDRMAEGTSNSRYEALLDEYEPGAKVEDLQRMFDELRPPLVALIAEIKEAQNQPPVEILRRSYDIDKQRSFSRLVSERIGFDYSSGRLDETSHPFCTTLGPNDIRILTRFESNWLPGGLYGTLHEAGHGMYEQGLRSDWFGLPPGSYVSLGIHESQSRLWENQVGRSREFWSWLTDKMKRHFSPTLDDVSLGQLYFAFNTVRPSLIRVEADEATYNLHILIRFDLERQLIEGHLTVDDLPSAWNARYQSDLGIMSPSDANGVLQDVHWSAGLMGYFPTYTLGNLAAAQLFETACQSIGTVPDQISRGEFQPLADWLSEHVHLRGRCMSGVKLIEQATGKSLSAAPLLNHLNEKLRPLYGLA